jgi:hypothetical protein
VGNQLAFGYPFSGHNSLTFTNCFASVYMFLEQIVGIDDYPCRRRDGEPCDGCGNCRNTTAGKQEDYYFILDTMSGRSAARPDFAGASVEVDSAPATIEFLMGLLGYGYRTVQEGMLAAIRAAIDAGTPVLARMKDESNGAFRVIVGYDGDALVAADPARAQGKPQPPSLDQIAELVLVTAKTQPAFTFGDALKRIQTVMVGNREARIWDQYGAQFRYWGELEQVDFEEVRRRLKRMCDISWYNFNCHNFAETFRHRVWEPLKDPRLDEVCRQISVSYDQAHTRNWQIIGLHECRDWSTRRYHELEWGYCTSVALCLEMLAQSDAEVLGAIEQAIAIVAARPAP